MSFNTFGRSSLKDAGENVDLVRLEALRGETREPRSSSVDLALYLFWAEGDKRRNAVEDASHRDAVAFSPAGEAQNFAEGIEGHAGARREGEVLYSV